MCGLEENFSCFCTKHRLISLYLLKIVKPSYTLVVLKPPFDMKLSNEVDLKVPLVSSDSDLGFVASLPTVPMVAPNNVQVHVINSTLAKVHWDPVPLKTVRGHLQGYRVSNYRSYFNPPFYK